MDLQKIKDALAKLQADNDNHWTQDGKPKLETVKLFSQGEAVNREILDEHFPNFNRENTSLEQPKADDVVVSDATTATGSDNVNDQAQSQEGANTTPAEVSPSESASSEVSTGAETKPTKGESASSVTDVSTSVDPVDGSVPLLQSLLEFVKSAVADRNALEDPKERVDVLNQAVADLHDLRAQSLVAIRELEQQADLDIRAAQAVQPKHQSSVIQDYFKVQDSLPRKVETTVEKSQFAIDEPRKPGQPGKR